MGNSWIDELQADESGALTQLMHSPATNGPAPEALLQTFVGPPRGFLDARLGAGGVRAARAQVERFEDDEDSDAWLGIEQLVLKAGAPSDLVRWPAEFGRSGYLVSEALARALGKTPGATLKPSERLRTSRSGG